MNDEFGTIQNPLQSAIDDIFQYSDDEDENTDLMPDESLNKPKEYPIFKVKETIYSIQQLYDFLEDILSDYRDDEQDFEEDKEEKPTIPIKEKTKILSELYNIKNKAIKIKPLRAEFQKWLRDFLNHTSEIFIMNPKIVGILSEIFLILFPENDEASTVLISLMETSLECCSMAIRIFDFYISKTLKLDPFDKIIHKIFNFLQNMDLRSLCLSIIKESLINSHYLLQTLNFQEQGLAFLVTSDDPISISNGLKICIQMIEIPPQKFPENTYDFFLTEVVKAIIFFANEEIINDILIFHATEISLRFKNIEFFYLMEPNDLIFDWLSSIFLISERYLDQNQIANSDLSYCLDIISNLINFWLLPPNLLKVKNNPTFIKWKDDFISLCMNFFLKKKHFKQFLKIITEIMDHSSFTDHLGAYYSTNPDFKDIIHHQLKHDPRNIGNCVLISIFASILKEREFTKDIKPFVKNDLRTLHHIVKYYYQFPLQQPEAPDQFLFSDAHSRVLKSFSSTYLEDGRIFINDHILKDISLLYIRTLTNLQANDESKERLSLAIEAILRVPFDIIIKLCKTSEIIPVISELEFNFISNTNYKQQTEDLYNHLFTIHDDQLDESLLSAVDLSYSNENLSSSLFIIVRSFIRNCIDEDHVRTVEIVMPIILKSLESQLFLSEISKTIKVMSEKNFQSKCIIYSLNTVLYVKTIIDLVHLLIEQFESALPIEEEKISRNILKIFTNLLVIQPINFGFLAFYSDFCFRDIIDEFFSLLFSKDLSFFCRDKKFVLYFVQFLDAFIDSELESENLFNSISTIVKNIFDLHIIDQDVLAQICDIVLFLIENCYNVDELLPSVFIFKLSEEPKISIFNKMLILLCRAKFDIFVSLLDAKGNYVSEDADELVQYICSELESETFEYSAQFEADFIDCIDMMKIILNYNLIKDNEIDVEEEEENIEL